MVISSEMVKSLRLKTGAGMMDCKKALEASDGDMEKAIEYLRKKGAATAEKRADKVANQGIIVTKVSEDGKQGIILEINCETDFVARSEDFIGFANGVAAVIESKLPKDVPALLALQYSADKTVANALAELVGKIGEKIEIKRFEIFHANESVIQSYTHMGSKIGVLVELAVLSPKQEHKSLARDIAMQVAAMSPMVVARDQVAKSIVEKELEIYRQQAKNEGKPDQVVNRIADGRLEKFYQEAVLLEQSFIKDAGKTIKELLSEASSDSNGNVSVRRFKRFQLGDSQ
jgi:elongation factor Ts